MPVLDYGAEVVGKCTKGLKKLENWHTDAAKKLLEESVASCVVRGELGWRMVEERYDEAKLTYYMRLKGMEGTRLAKKTFLESTREELPWWVEMREALEKYGVERERKE